MEMSTSALRANIYRVFDEVLKTGQPIEVRRGERRLRIVPVAEGSRLDRLTPHPEFVVGDPADLADVHWTREGELVG